MLPKEHMPKKLIRDNVNQYKDLWGCLDYICDRSKPETKINKIKSGQRTLLQSKREVLNITGHLVKAVQKKSSTLKKMIKISGTSCLSCQ